MAGSGHPDAADPGAKTDPSRAYSDSKASDVLLASAWGRRLPQVSSVAVDPGWVKTKLASYGAPGTVDTSADSLTFLCTEADLGQGLYWRGRRTITVPKHLRDEAYADALAATCDRWSPPTAGQGSTRGRASTMGRCSSSRDISSPGLGRLRRRRYEEAWDEWDSSGEAQVWETALADGLLPEAVG